MCVCVCMGVRGVGRGGYCSKAGSRIAVSECLCERAKVYLIVMWIHDSVVVSVSCIIVCLAFVTKCFGEVDIFINIIINIIINKI